MGERFPKITVDQLTVGMFVSDLDRPWLDTPFIVQGVLIETEDDLEVFRELCQYVYIDPHRSTVKIKFLEEHSTRAREPAMVLKGAKATEYVIIDRRAQPAETGRTLEDEKVEADEKVSLNSARAALAFNGWRHGSVTRSTPPPMKAEPATTPPPAQAAATGAPQSTPPSQPSPGTVAAAQMPVPAQPATVHADVRRGPSSQLPSELEPNLDALRSGAEGRVVSSSESVRKLAQAIARLESRLATMGGTQPGQPGGTGDGPVLPVPQTLVPPTVTKLVEYREERPVEAELPRAQQTLASTEQTLERIVQDIEMGNTLHMDKVQQTSNDLVDTMVANPDAMMWVARLRNADKKTYAHGLRVAVYLLALGRHMGFPRNELRSLGMIGMLIDVGKVRVPRELLEKRGKLTNAEYEEIKRHVDYGLEILQGTRGMSREVLEGIAQHHERMKGQGYPHGLRDSQISVYGRMAGLADCFAALVSPRPYAEAMAPSDSMLRLFEWSGEYFQPALVERFVQAIGVFPVGTLVELSTGHVGVVLRHNRLRRLQPKVLLLTDSQKKPRPQPMEVDLLRDGARVDGEPVRIVRGLPAGAFGLDVDGYTASAQPAMLGSTQV